MKSPEEILQDQLNEAKERLNKLQTEWDHANIYKSTQDKLGIYNESIANQQNYIIKLNEQLVILKSGMQPIYVNSNNPSSFFSSANQQAKNDSSKDVFSQYFSKKQ